MEFPVEPNSPSQSIWQGLQSWSLNTWPDGDPLLVLAPGVFLSDQGQLTLSLMDENDWNEQDNFSVGICPVAY
jgi:hypothetical protein